MKINTIIYPILLIVVIIISGCNPAPETYNQAIQKFNEKSFEEAITLFKLTPKSTDKWHDSSVVMIKRSIDSIYAGNDLARLTKLCKTYELDSVMKPILVTKTIAFWSKTLTVNPKLGFNIFDSLHFILKAVPGVDTIMRKNEDAFFNGIWRCPKGSLKGNEIYFERDKKTQLIRGKSNKSGSGWDLGKTIYNDIYYVGNNILDHKVRVFSTDYWGYTTEYFTKNKGKMSIQSSDSLFVDYEGAVRSNNKVLFVKQKR
jgi:hypothetical protein